MNRNNLFTLTGIIILTIGFCGYVIVTLDVWFLLSLIGLVFILLCFEDSVIGKENDADLFRACDVGRVNRMDRNAEFRRTIAKVILIFIATAAAAAIFFSYPVSISSVVG